MTNIIISSEMRVGSRWLHYLLKDLYGMRPSREIGRHRVKNEKESVLNHVKSYFEEERIVKFHGLRPKELFELLPKEVFGDYKVIFIVRNPRDRGISLAFHHKSEKGYDRWKKLTDEEAIKRVFLESNELKNGNEIIFETMKKENSLFHTIRKQKTDNSYVWTTYEWMIEDIFNQIVGINMYLEDNFEMIFSDSKIETAIMKNDFNTKTGRQPGEEVRTDTWRRKGVVGDWLNHIDGEIFDASRKDWDRYWELVELGRNTSK